MNHFIEKCSECGITISQCRCPGFNSSKTIRRGICVGCKSKHEINSKAYDDLNPNNCEVCIQFTTDYIDRVIYHRNGHVWPGFAGDP